MIIYGIVVRPWVKRLWIGGQKLCEMPPELEEMDEGTREGLMREIRAIYEEDDSVLKSFIYEPVEGYL